METSQHPIAKCIGSFFEVLSWSELFRFAHASQADTLVKLYNQEATWHIEGANDPLGSANVQITSWSTASAGLDGYKDIGILIQRITVRTDIAEAGFRVKTMDAMANAITLSTPEQIARYMEPVDLLPWVLKHLWYVRKWPGTGGFPGGNQPKPGSYRKPWRKWK